MKDSSQKWVDFKFPNYDPYRDAEGYELDVVAGQDAIDFFHECITHVKGEKAGKSFTLELWQQAFIGHLFGWKKPDGTRRFSEVYFSTARKQGKTSIAAGLAIYTLLCDNEPGCEVYLAAGDRNQAGICYDIMSQMINRSKELQKRCKVYRNHVRTPDGFCKVISADAPTKLGFNGHCIIIDELISQPKRDLVDVLVTSTAARRQPLVIYLTTAGWDRQSICYEKYSYAKNICSGSVKDASFFPVIYEVEDADANYFSPATWKQANPNLGSSISEDWLARKADVANETPAFENTFRTLHLNQWAEAESRFFPMADWDACPTMIDLDALEGNECYIGCDMASKEDVAALCAVFPPTSERSEYVVLGKYFIPNDTLFERVRRHNVSYDQWEKQGRVITTPGPTIDPERIFEQVSDWCKLYDVREFVYDPHGAEWIVAKWESTFGEDNSVMISGAITKISGPIMTMYEKIRQHKINFGGCPVLRWMGANTTVEFSKDGLVKPVKPQNHLKIDGVIACAIALSRAALSEFNMEEETESIYESQGLVMIGDDSEQFLDGKGPYRGHFEI